MEEPVCDNPIGPAGGMPQSACNQILSEGKNTEIQKSCGKCTFTLCLHFLESIKYPLCCG